MALKFLAERADMPSLSAKDIAEAYGIPLQLLAKILQRLTKAGCFARMRVPMEVTRYRDPLRTSPRLK